MQKKRLWSRLIGIASLIVFVFIGNFSKEVPISSKTSVNATVNTLPMVYPCGFPIGIYLRTNGLLVIGTAQVCDDMGKLCEPVKGSIMPGDYILSINGEAIPSKEFLQKKLNEYGQNPVTLVVKHEEEERILSIQPVHGADGEYRLGIWVKDDTQGIGTLTYLTEDGRFGALGHPISDVDTGKMVNARQGGLYQAQIKMVIRGENGTPGSFSGIICYDQSTCFGTIEKNTESGIFGSIDGIRIKEFKQSELCQVARRQEVSCKEAYLRCTIDGETKNYSIIIQNLYAESCPDKGFLFQVTDPELLEKTGGIVQGMSGSPIIQNGKLVGAVTHVFVNDPTKGYGIFAETMLEAAE